MTYFLSREAMEKTFRAIARIAPGSVVVFDYGTDANIKAYRKPLGLLHKAILKAVREPQTFWISSEPPVKAYPCANNWTGAPKRNANVRVVALLLLRS